MGMHLCASASHEMCYGNCMYVGGGEWMDVEIDIPSLVPLSCGTLVCTPRLARWLVETQSTNVPDNKQSIPNTHVGFYYNMHVCMYVVSL